MGVHFTPKLPKPVPGGDVSGLETRVGALEQAAAETDQVVNTLLGVTDDA